MIDRLNASLAQGYRIERELGEGGMATVFLAEDLKHHRKVALKVLKPELAAVVGGERFLTEIETTARLQHPNILPLFDSGEADGFLYYVMPYVKGESLRDRLEREKQLPVDEAVRIVTEVAEALHSAHGHGIVHRDVKPANILLSQGRPLVADFGIALALSAAGGHRLTETGLSVGTPHYMSPEQATGDQKIGPASDVYSLGCVLYEMLAGEPPYTGGTAQAILGKVITSDPEPITARRRTVPPHVESVVARALEKVPADRFASAADFAAALADRGFRHGPDRSSAAGPRAKWLAAAGWGLAAVLGGLLLMSTLEPEDPPDIKKLSLAILEQDGPSEWFELTPDGSALIISDGRTYRGRTLSIRRLDDLTRTPILGSEGAYDPITSPDGTMVAWGSDNGLYVAPLSGGARRTLVPEGQICCLRWGEDGYVYFTLAPGRILSVRATGGEPEVLLEGQDGMPGFYTPLTGGERAVFAVYGTPERIEMLDTRSGERRTLTEGVRPFVTDDGYLIFGRAGGGIYGALLDVDAMELASSPVLLVEGVGMGGDAYFTVSESGDLAYWTAAGDTEEILELIWVGREGQVTPVDTTWRGQFESVALSPDGARAAVTVLANGTDIAATEIWVKDLDNGLARRLTSYRGMNRRPVWSPDGKSLAFISDRGGRRAAYTVPVDGFEDPEVLLEHPDADVDEIFWSGDGRWLVYRTGTSQGDRDIYARRVGSDSTTLVVAAGPGVDERAPALSPDGRWIAYVSDQTGQDEIWARPFPDVQRGSRQVSFDVGVEPVWSERGDELFFRSRPGFTSVRVGSGTDFSMGAPQALFANRLSTQNVIHRSYSFDQPGDRFLMTRVAGRDQTAAELILVQNWMEEVRARVGN